MKYNELSLAQKRQVRKTKRESIINLMLVGEIIDELLPFNRVIFKALKQSYKKSFEFDDSFEAVRKVFSKGKPARVLNKMIDKQLEKVVFVEHNATVIRV